MINNEQEKFDNLARVVYNSYVKHYVKDTGKFDVKSIIDGLREGLENSSNLGRADGYVEGYRDATNKLKTHVDQLSQTVERMNEIIAHKEDKIFELRKAKNV